VTGSRGRRQGQEAGAGGRAGGRWRKGSKNRAAGRRAAVRRAAVRRAAVRRACGFAASRAESLRLSGPAFTYFARG